MSNLKERIAALPCSDALHEALELAVARVQKEIPDILLKSFEEAYKEIGRRDRKQGLYAAGAPLLGRDS